MNFFLEPYPKISSHVQFYITKNASSETKISKKNFLHTSRTDGQTKTSSKEQSGVNGNNFFKYFFCNLIKILKPMMVMQ